MSDVTITVDLMPPQLEAAISQAKGLASRMRADKRMQKALLESARIAREYLGERFDELSEGGADELGESWEPLKESVQKSKSRRGRGRNFRTGRFTKKGDHGILKGRTGLLRDALDEDTPGPGYFEEVDGMELSVTLGYAGDAAHGTDAVSVARLAEIHQEGNENLPARVIIPKELPQRVVDEMSEPVLQALDEMGVELAKEDVDDELKTSGVIKDLLGLL